MLPMTPKKPTVQNIPIVDLPYGTPVPLTEQPLTGSRAFLIETPIPQTARFVAADAPAPPREPAAPRLHYLTLLSILVGICLGVSAIVGGLGKAFYVEKDAYTQDKIESINRLNSMTSSMAEVSSSLKRLEAAVSSLSAEVKTLREAPARRR